MSCNSGPASRSGSNRSTKASAGWRRSGCSGACASPSSRHGDESKRDVLVSVEEAPATTVGFGGGVEAGELLLTDEETKSASQHLEVAPRAFFEIGRRNLFGKNRSVNLFTRVSLGNLQNQTTSKGLRRIPRDRHLS